MCIFKDSTVFLGSLAFFGVAYVAAKKVVPSLIPCADAKALRQQRAWYLTTISSVCASLLGVAFLGRVVVHGFGAEFRRDDTATDRAFALFFVAYCVGDLVAGKIEYAEQIDWQSGWTHHAFYACGLALLLLRGHCKFFTAGLVEELPTIYLSWVRLHNGKELRWPFALGYFVLRILYHMVAVFESLEHSTLAFALGLVILRQHMWWFAGWWRGASQDAHAAGPQESRFDEKQTQLPLRVKLGVCGSMVLVQVATMLHVTIDGYGRRTWVFGTLSGLGLLATWVYFSFLGVAIFVDTYTRGFIELAIKEQKVIYNISWEDPRVEREDLHLSSDDVVLTISSAGCNVLDYLLEKPRHITAVDLNEAQLAVLDLKLACVAAKMPQPDFFALWGRSDPRVFTENYRPRLRKLLRRDASRAYWDRNLDELFCDNWMFTGTSGVMAYLLMLMARPLGLSGSLQRNLGAKEAPTSSSVLSLGIRLLSSPVVWTWAAPLGGIPPEQLALVERRPRVFSDRIHEILGKRMWSRDNYFYHGYCCGQFDEFPKCPRYMAADFYPRLLAMDEAELRRRVTLFHGSWGDAEPPAGTRGFTFVSLLDSMDWMPPKLCATLVRDMLKRVDRGACRVFWRSYAPGPSLQERKADLFTVHSPALAQLPHAEVETYDRVGWYLSQWRATVPEDLDLDALVPAGTGSVYANGLKDDLLVCYAMAKQALQKEKDVAAFYSTQGQAYDGFREALLPGRDTLLKHAVPWSAVPKLLAKPSKPTYALVCVGCGTARDVEFVAEHLKTLPKSARVALCDLSPDLLAMAKQRVEALGLGDRVDCVRCDITKPLADLAKLGLKRGDACAVTCSYCLTMIPDWRAAVENMLALVVDGGALGLIDFTQRFDREDDVFERIYKKWFALDGVYFDRGHVALLAEKTTPVFYTESRSRVPYTPWFPTHYIYVGTKTK